MDTPTLVTYLILSILAFVLLGIVLAKILSGQLALQIWYFILGLYSTILAISFYILYGAIIALLTASNPDSQQSLQTIFAILFRDNSSEQLTELIKNLRGIPKELQEFLVGCLLTLIWLNLIYPLVSFVIGIRNGSRDGSSIKIMQTELGKMSTEIDVTRQKIDTLLEIFTHSPNS
jgi:hypothetical protein